MSIDDDRFNVNLTRVAISNVMSLWQDIVLTCERQHLTTGQYILCQSASQPVQTRSYAVHQQSFPYCTTYRVKTVKIPVII